MKQILALAILAFSVLVQPSSASDSSSPHSLLNEERSWFCTASGYDRLNHRKTISGQTRDTEEQARSSAMQICRLANYSVCRVESCFNTARIGKVY